MKLGYRSAYRFKNNYQSGRLRDRLNFLSGNVCVCGAQTNGQRLHWSVRSKERGRDEEEERESQQGPLAVWDWDRRTSRGFDLEETSDR